MDMDMEMQASLISHSFINSLGHDPMSQPLTIGHTFESSLVMWYILVILEGFIPLLLSILWSCRIKIDIVMLERWRMGGFLQAET
jgi:hypothetical protein